MNVNGEPPIEPALQAINAHWMTSVIAAAVTHKIFDFLERRSATLAEVSEACRIPERGARAVLDALFGAGFVHVQGEYYANSETASCYFVEGKPLYLGDLARLSLQLMSRAVQFPEAVAQGKADLSLKSTIELPQWAFLVRATAPFSIPVAKVVARLLRVAEQGPIEILDPGGGAGVFSAILLKENPHALATQLDWPTVNVVARDWVATFGVAARFRTVDGDLFAFDYPAARYDIIIFSQMAHGLSLADNLRAFRMFHGALKPAGVLLINDLLPELDGSASQQALLSSARTFYATECGVGYRFSEYQEMLQTAGFRNILRHETGTPTTLIAANL